MQLLLQFVGCVWFFSNGSVIVDFQMDFSGRDIATDFILTQVQTVFIEAVNSSTFGDYEVELQSLEFEGDKFTNIGYTVSF